MFLDFLPLALVLSVFYALHKRQRKPVAGVTKYVAPPVIGSTTPTVASATKPVAPVTGSATFTPQLGEVARRISTSKEVAGAVVRVYSYPQGYERFVEFDTRALKKRFGSSLRLEPVKQSCPTSYHEVMQDTLTIVRQMVGK